MKFLVTACLLSERLRPRPRADVVGFFEENEILIPFATILTIERGLQLLAHADGKKELLLRGQVDALISEHKIFEGSDRQIASAMARILAHGPLRHMWLPNGRAKHPAYGHYIWVAAASLVTDIHIAAVKTSALEKVSAYFGLPGIYAPVGKLETRSRLCGGAMAGETLPSDSASPAC